MSVRPVHVDVVIDNVRPLERVRVVVVVEMDQVVLALETHDHTVLQGG